MHSFAKVINPDAKKKKKMIPMELSTMQLFWWIINVKIGTPFLKWKSVKVPLMKIIRKFYKSILRSIYANILFAI